MFDRNGPWIGQQHSALESPAFRSYMNAPVNTRQHEVLPASINPCNVSANLGFNKFGISDWPGNSMLYSPNPCCTPDGSPLLGEKPWTLEKPCLQPRKFLVFDQSGNETRLMFSSLFPGVQKFPSLQEPSPKQFDAFKFLTETKAKNSEKVFSKTPIVSEESGENEILDEMREDTEEINALLYSDDYDDQDTDFDDEDDDEVSSGHSPLVEEVLQKSDLDDEVSISSISLKKRKTLEAYENIHSEDFSNAIDNGSKRPRKDKVHDTLKALEKILPGLKSTDPIVILDEAIKYLKCLKQNAETTSAENYSDSTTSGCYEPSN